MLNSFRDSIQELDTGIYWREQLVKESRGFLAYRTLKPLMLMQVRLYGQCFTVQYGPRHLRIFLPQDVYYYA